MAVPVVYACVDCLRELPSWIAFVNKFISRRFARDDSIHSGWAGAGRADPARSDHDGGRQPGLLSAAEAPALNVFGGAFARSRTSRPSAGWDAGYIVEWWLMMMALFCL